LDNRKYNSLNLKKIIVIFLNRIIVFNFTRIKNIKIKKKELIIQYVLNINFKLHLKRLNLKNG